LKLIDHYKKRVDDQDSDAQHEELMHKIDETANHLEQVGDGEGQPSAEQLEDVLSCLQQVLRQVHKVGDSATQPKWDKEEGLGRAEEASSSSSFPTRWGSAI